MDGENRPLIWNACYMERSIVRGDNPFHNGQAKTSAFSILRAGRIRLIEATLYFGKIIFLHPNAVILNLDNGFFLYFVSVSFTYPSVFPYLIPFVIRFIRRRIIMDSSA